MPLGVEAGDTCHPLVKTQIRDLNLHKDSFCISKTRKTRIRCTFYHLFNPQRFNEWAFGLE